MEPQRRGPRLIPIISEPLLTLFRGPTPRSQPLLHSAALAPAGVIGGGDVGSFAALSEALSETDAEAVVIDGEPGERLEAVMEALAADLHVLVFPPLAADPDDAHRCAFIALNRGVRLMIADTDLHPDSGEMAEAFRAYALEDVEPPSSARKWLGR